MSAVTATAPKKKQSRFKEIWKRFKRNPLAMVGLVIIILLIILALSADLISPSDGVVPGYNLQNWGNARQFPSFENLLGTDHLGRDVLARIAHGARISLAVGLVVVTISMSAGLILGSLAGFYGGHVDNVIMRIIDIMLAVPTLLLAIAIAAVLGGGLFNVMIAVGIGGIPGYARIVRAQVLTLREQEFVEAARSCGASDFRLIRRHILPNCMAPIIVEASMGMAGAIMSAAALSFIGIGLQPPTPEWGAMLSEGRAWLLAGFWHLTVFPGLAIALIIFSLNMMGDGLRDALDPKLRSAGFSNRKFRKIQLKNAEDMLQAIKEDNEGAKGEKSRE
ncbi:MAG: ABC transporter permease [Defluviitaleaceae bacterium]|nr:ABC transporter permease [Defluviitaleaceae bacterium]